MKYIFLLAFWEFSGHIVSFRCYPNPIWTHSQAFLTIALLKFILHLVLSAWERPLKTLIIIIIIIITRNTMFADVPSPWSPEIFFCGNNVELLLVLNILTMKCVQGSSSIPTAKAWQADIGDIFPVQTEEYFRILKRYGRRCRINAPKRCHEAWN